jgi:hypothetical protein
VQRLKVQCMPSEILTHLSKTERIMVTRSRLNHAVHSWWWKWIVNSIKYKEYGVSVKIWMYLLHAHPPTHTYTHICVIYPDIFRMDFLITQVTNIKSSNHFFISWLSNLMKENYSVFTKCSHQLNTQRIHTLPNFTMVIEALDLWKYAYMGWMFIL